jgi:D-xylose transport system permease protein
LSDFLRKNGAWIGFFGMLLVFSLLTQGQFLSPRNISNLLRQTSINGVLACGMTLVILSGGIDLSIGSIVALSGVVVGMSQAQWGFADAGIPGVLGSVALGVVVGGLLGFANGGLVSTLNIAPFVITLGMMVVARGVAMIVTDGTGISPMGEDLRMIGEEYLSMPTTWLILAALAGLFFLLFRKRWANAIFPLITLAGFSFAFVRYKGFPILGLFLLGVLGFTAFILNYTVFGRCVYSVGSNEQASYWSGVPIRKVKWAVYTAMGLLSGLGGVLLTARLNSAVPTAGNLFELDAIAAAVIGGTSLKGGKGTVLGSLAGALTMATLNNGMDLMQVSSFYQMVLKGTIIICAVALDRGQRG